MDLKFAHGKKKFAAFVFGCFVPDMSVVIADCSPLVAFSAIHRMDIPQSIFTEVWVPSAVYKEAVTDGENWVSAHDLQTELAKRTWLSVKPMLANSVAPGFRHLGAGEAEALTMALETGLPVLMDDRKGRTAAGRHGISVRGTLAVIALAKGKGLIDRAGPLVERMIAAGIHFHPDLIRKLLEKLGETRMC